MPSSCKKRHGNLRGMRPDVILILVDESTLSDTKPISALPLLLIYVNMVTILPIRIHHLVRSPSPMGDQFWDFPEK